MGRNKKKNVSPSNHLIIRKQAGGDRVQLCQALLEFMEVVPQEVSELGRPIELRQLHVGAHLCQHVHLGRRSCKHHAPSLPRFPLKVTGSAYAALGVVIRLLFYSGEGVRGGTGPNRARSEAGGFLSIVLGFASKGSQTVVREGPKIAPRWYQYGPNMHARINIPWDPRGIGSSLGGGEIVLVTHPPRTFCIDKNDKCFTTIKASMARCRSRVLRRLR